MVPLPFRIGPTSNNFSIYLQISPKSFPTSAVRRVSRGQRNIPPGHYALFYTLEQLLFIQVTPLLNYSHEAEGGPFQIRYFSENLLAVGIEPEISGSVARNSDH
jgi:hypothetical protein